MSPCPVHKMTFPVVLQRGRFWWSFASQMSFCDPCLPSFACSYLPSLIGLIPSLLLAILVFYSKIVFLCSTDDFGHFWVLLPLHLPWNLVSKLFLLFLTFLYAQDLTCAPGFSCTPKSRFWWFDPEFAGKLSDQSICGLCWFCEPRFYSFCFSFTPFMPVCSMWYRRFWWFCPLFVNACACLLIIKLRESLTFSQISIRFLVQGGTNVGRQTLSRGSSLFFTNICGNESESAYKYPGCLFLVLATCSPILNVTTLNTNVLLKSQNFTFSAWIYQNQCLGITNLRARFPPISWVLTLPFFLLILAMICICLYWRRLLLPVDSLLFFCIFLEISEYILVSVFSYLNKIWKFY